MPHLFGVMGYLDEIILGRECWENVVETMQSQVFQMYLGNWLVL